jgi:hypothetical protein
MTQPVSITIIIQTTEKIVEQPLQMVYDILDTHGQWCLEAWLCLQQVSLQLLMQR